MSLALALLVIAGCPGAPSEPAHPRGGSARADAGVPVPPAGPSDAECDQLVAHALELQLAELRATKPADQLPDAAEVDKLRAELRAADPGCKDLSRAAYRCALAAKTLAELAGCDSQP